MKKQGGGDPSDSQWTALDSAGLLWEAADTNDWLLAIDDTDNLESRGTGYRARQLALFLAEAGLARPKGITRHQLLVDPRIPYTSHNSSACLVLTGVSDPDRVFSFGCDYLITHSAPGSDAGITLIRRTAMDNAIIDFGHRAQKEVVDQEEARALAQRYRLPMAGLTGTGGGVIGALAATGLHATGSDGRFLWLRNLRALANQVRDVHYLQRQCGLRMLSTVLKREVPEPHALVTLGAWPRAVFLDHQPTLLVEATHESGVDRWRVASREFIKQF